MTAYPLNEVDQARFWERVLLPDENGCMLWTKSVDRDGYGQFTLTRPKRRAKPHRLSAQIAGLEIDGQVVRHSCDVPRCVAPDHLSVGSQAENMADMVSRQRNTFGETHPFSKLTEDLVVHIASRFLAGDRQTDIARANGVSKYNVRDIVQGRAWRHATSHLLGAHWAGRKDQERASHRHPAECAVGCQCERRSEVT